MLVADLCPLHLGEGPGSAIEERATVGFVQDLAMPILTAPTLVAGTSRLKVPPP
jgi:hypothetical protein